jgi:hypothetical protein
LEEVGFREQALDVALDEQPVEDYQAEAFGVAIAAPGLGVDEATGVVDAGDGAGAHGDVGVEIGIKRSGVLVVGDVMFFQDDQRHLSIFLYLRYIPTSM